MASYDINHQPKLLKGDDFVLFHVPGHSPLKYKVWSDHLNNGGANRQVFLDLGYESEWDRDCRLYQLCDKFYGYSNHGGDWPASNFGDFPALTRLVNHLYKLIFVKTLPAPYLQSTPNHPDGFLPARPDETETESNL